MKSGAKRLRGEPTGVRLNTTVHKDTKAAYDELRRLTGKSGAALLKEALTAMLDAVRAEQRDATRES